MSHMYTYNIKHQQNFTYKTKSGAFDYKLNIKSNVNWHLKVNVWHIDFQNRDLTTFQVHCINQNWSILTVITSAIFSTPKYAAPLSFDQNYYKKVVCVQTRNPRVYQEVSVWKVYCPKKAHHFFSDSKV